MLFLAELCKTSDYLAMCVQYTRNWTMRELSRRLCCPLCLLPTWGGVFVFGQEPTPAWRASAGWRSRRVSHPSAH